MASTSGSAERLQKTSGAWRLEFQQLVYNSPILLRPKRFAVQGEQAILQQLRELSGHEPLVRDTERLFRGALPDGVYVAREGRWFPELLPEALPDPEPEQPDEQSLSESSERGRLLLEEVARRMLALEQSVDQLQEKLDSSLSGLASAAASGVMNSAAVGGATAQARTQQAEPVRAPPPSAPAPTPAPQPEAAAAVAGSAAPVASNRESAVSLPTASALTDLVRGLAGPDASLAPCDRTDWAALSSAGTSVFFAVFQDNDGDEAGSIIFDLEAALRMAGALLMESEEFVESLLEEKVMSDEMLDAASEVCNTLTSALNKVSGNPHLRSGKMQPFTEARAAQLATAAKRDDYRYNQGGRLSLVAC